MLGADIRGKGRMEGAKKQADTLEQAWLQLGLLEGNYEWFEGGCWVSLDSARLALSEDTQHPHHLIPGRSKLRVRFRKGLIPVSGCLRLIMNGLMRGDG